MTNAEVRSYAVRVFRDSDLWVIEVPELDVVSQSRNLAGAEDVPVERVAVTMDYSEVDRRLGVSVTEARSTQAAADEMIRSAAVTRRQAARRLVREEA